MYSLGIELEVIMKCPARQFRVERVYGQGLGFEFRVKGLGPKV